MLIFSLETTFLQLEKKKKKNKKNYMHSDFAMQRGEGSIPAQETKIPHAVRHSRVTQNKEFTIWPFLSIQFRSVNTVMQYSNTHTKSDKHFLVSGPYLRIKSQKWYKA